MIVAVMQGTDMTPQQYDRVVADLEAAGLGCPAGLIEHVAGWTRGRFCVIDVWEDVQSFATYGLALYPILAQNGVATEPPEVYDLHREIRLSEGDRELARR